MRKATPAGKSEAPERSAQHPADARALLQAMARDAGVELAEVRRVTARLARAGADAVRSHRVYELAREVRSGEYLRREPGLPDSVADSLCAELELFERLRSPAGEVKEAAAPFPLRYVDEDCCCRAA